MPPRPLFLTLLLTLPGLAADTRLVRETEPLSAEEERQKLTVPEGFEIQLFASEPMIHKPINMAFDARGRLWVSTTTEYPYSADKSRWSDAQGTHVKDSRDAIKILEDTDGDGRADKVTDFADGLNIPTGVVPWHRPEHKAGCIAWSIPNIWYFADTDGDGTADLREVLFGPLGYEKDTHGMCSSFRLGLDGWIYATHGFNNTSTFRVRRPAGTSADFTDSADEKNASAKSAPSADLELHSGNVFRFRPDGSRVEAWTHGQVNPFGLAWDRYGNLYSADCHSSPVYQLIRGAHYPSFGKPHDGLGFAPVMCQHTHGSTGICGIVYLDGGVWGPEWDDHVFLGNVVTSRVNLDKVTFTGSTPKANERPDFVTSTDPWFRPVDLQLGPDNALYIADFYNRIIGHYEVPLDHPGRDRERGRIWRVVKKLAHRSKQMRDPDLEFIRKLRQIEAGPPLNSLPKELELDPFKEPQDSPHVMLARALALRNMAHDAELRTQALLQLYMIGLHYRKDEILHHTCRIGQRSLFLDHPGMIKLLPQDASIPTAMPSSTFIQDMSDILLTVPHSDASEWLFKMGPNLSEEPSGQIQRFNHIARYGDESLVKKMIASHRNSNDAGIATSIFEGLSERGMSPPTELLAWARELAEEHLASAGDHPESSWLPVPQTEPAPVWSLRARPCADGVEARVLQSMGQGGGAEESRTGTLKSRAFAAPEKLVLWLNGHRGPPTVVAHEKNLVRVVESDTGTTLAYVFPPRHDTAQRAELDLAAHAGKAVHLEMVDGDAGKAYAWLGITRIEPPVVSVEDFEVESQRRDTLQKLAVILQHSAPVVLREKLATYLPPRPAPPPLPVSPEQRQQLDALITARNAAYAKAVPNKTHGAQIFQTHCAACHQIGGQGGLIGPQLDGIGTRGVERLCEDILDPNRNVDAHFHLHILTLQDGSTLSGFLKAEAGQVLILADAAGREQRVSKSTVIKDDVQPLSLMPPVFGQTIAEKDFADLLGWLLEK